LPVPGEFVPPELAFLLLVNCHGSPSIISG
jgi:hypothetical protein